jgi:hypothetical protein
MTEGVGQWLSKPKESEKIYLGQKGRKLGKLNKFAIFRDLAQV